MMLVSSVWLAPRVSPTLVLEAQVPVDRVRPRMGRGRLELLAASNSPWSPSGFSLNGIVCCSQRATVSSAHLPRQGGMGEDGECEQHISTENRRSVLRG